MGSVKAELLRLWKWPATWVLIGVWLVLTLTFGYLFNYLALNGGSNTRDLSQQQLISALQPENVGAAVVRGLPMFGGAIILVLAALAVGSGYGWGTWKTTLTAGPRRISAMGGTLGALAVIVTLVVALTFVVNLGAAITVASLEGWDWSFPGLDVFEPLGASLLIAAMWTGFGVFLGVVTKGPALAVGLGLMWAIVTENLLRGVGSLLGPGRVADQGPARWFGRQPRRRRRRLGCARRADRPERHHGRVVPRRVRGVLRGRGDVAEGAPRPRIGPPPSRPGQARPRAPRGSRGRAGLGWPVRRVPATATEPRAARGLRRR